MTIGSRLTAGQDSTLTVNELDFVELGLFCADVCRVLDQGTNGRGRDEFNRSVHGAMDLLRMWVELTSSFLNRPFNDINCRTMTNIQRKLAKWGKRNAVSRRFHANSDKATIASWRLELDKPLQVFKVRSVGRLDQAHY